MATAMPNREVSRSAAATTFPIALTFGSLKPIGRLQRMYRVEECPSSRYQRERVCRSAHRPLTFRSGGIVTSSGYRRPANRGHLSGDPARVSRFDPPGSPVDLDGPIPFL